MLKPDIKNKPVWANYLAQDQDGKWAWFENKPSIQKGSASGYWAVKTGLWDEALDYTSDTWENTLEEHH